MVRRTTRIRGSKARAGLVSLVAPALLGSCLVASPPDFEDPAPDRPNVSVGLVVPAPWRTLAIERNTTTINFTVPFRASYTSEVLIRQLWLNWGLAGEVRLDQDFLEPEQDLENNLTFTWTPDLRVTPGCQQLTFVITHVSNISASEPRRPIDSNLTAFVTWWLNVDPDPTNPNTLVDCPSPSPE